MTTQTKEKIVKFRKLQERVNQIVGFGSYVERGPTMSSEERQDVIEYLHQLDGASKEEYEAIIPFARPFSIDDHTFQQRCLICRAKVNYCCC